MRKRLLYGALAGLAGGVAMKAVVRFLDPSAFGLSTDTDARTAHQIWRYMGWKPISEDKAAGIGAGMHYAFAAASGAVYVAFSERFPALRSGRGIIFGAGLWLSGDLIAVSAMGLEDPRRTPVRSHVSALAAHAMYGLIVEYGRRMI